jgi:hypothetical protein
LKKSLEEVRDSKDLISRLKKSEKETLEENKVLKKKINEELAKNGNYEEEILKIERKYENLEMDLFLTKRNSKEKENIVEKCLNDLERQLRELIENNENDTKNKSKSKIKELEEEVKNEKEVRKQFENEVKEINVNFRKGAELLSNELNKRIKKNKETFLDSQVQNKMVPKDEKYSKTTNKKKAIKENQLPGGVKSKVKTKVKNPPVFYNPLMKKDLTNLKSFYKEQNKYG